MSVEIIEQWFISGEAKTSATLVAAGRRGGNMITFSIDGSTAAMTIEAWQEFVEAIEAKRGAGSEQPSAPNAPGG